MAYKPRAGKNSRVSVNSTTLYMDSWSVTEQGDDLDATTFESGGAEEGIIGIFSVQWSFSGSWDAGRNSYDDPPGLYPRNDLSALRLYENLSDNIGWYFSTARVLSSRNGAQVRQKVTFEASGKNQGTYTRPTGSA